jgi:hypothetical protein
VSSCFGLHLAPQTFISIKVQQEIFMPSLRRGFKKKIDLYPEA